MKILQQYLRARTQTDIQSSTADRITYIYTVELLYVDDVNIGQEQNKKSYSAYMLYVYNM